MSIAKVGMPKFGLIMTEGTLAAWLVEEGATVSAGDELAEVETDKINGAVEAPAAGVLRRQVAVVGDVLPVGGLLGVVAAPDVSEEEVDAFVADFEATFVPETGEEETGRSSETVTVGGHAIRYVREGEGAQAVVFLHGFGGDLSSWLFNLEAAGGPGRTVYALDLPGHGRSTKDVGTGSLDELAATVGEALEALGVSGAHVVGHSLGGAVAIALAAARPQLVASLVLVAPAGLGPEIDGAYLEGFVAAESRRDLKPLLERLFSNPDVVTRQFTEDVLRTKRLDGVDAALRAIAGSCFAGGRQSIDLGSTLAGLDLPVLVIWGADDAIIPPAHAAGAPAGARVEIVAGAGHQPQMEVPGEVNRLVAGFLESASA